MEKQYIGDSVYMSYDGFQLCLTTENGFGPSNTIFLELDLLDRINDVAKVMIEKVHGTTITTAQNETE